MNSCSGLSIGKNQWLTGFYVKFHIVQIFFFFERPPIYRDHYFQVRKVAFCHHFDNVSQFVSPKTSYSFFSDWGAFGFVEIEIKLLGILSENKVFEVSSGLKPYIFNDPRRHSYP